MAESRISARKRRPIDRKRPRRQIDSARLEDPLDEPRVGCRGIPVSATPRQEATQIGVEGLEIALQVISDIKVRISRFALADEPQLVGWGLGWTIMGHRTTPGLDPDIERPKGRAIAA